MARQVKDTRLDTRTRRGVLKMRHEPYWRSLDQGAHLGYRKGKLGGMWIARWRTPKNVYRKEALGKADDKADADGIEILNFWQAQDKAREFFATAAAKAAGKGHGAYTVRQAVKDYLADYKTRSGKALQSMQLSINAHVLPKFGDLKVSDLSDSDIRGWHRKLANTPARLRTKKLGKLGEPLKQRYRPTPETDEEKRRRRVTANKVLAMLKATLNFAFSEGKASDDTAWRRVKPFRNVDAPRIRFLSEDEARRLVNACDTDFRKLVQAALLTGCRYGELGTMRCGDVHSETGIVHVRAGKGGKARDVTLTDEGVEFFDQMTVGRLGNERIFLREDGAPWGKSHQTRRLDETCRRAKISPPIGFHILRHCYGSWLAMKGTPLAVVARELGHADTRITERHYAHLSPSYAQEAVRQNFPELGIVEKANVVKARVRK